MIKKVKIKEAIGMVLAHDITRIIPGKFKGAAFKKGHIIKKEDIPEFLNIGKEHVYVLELTQDEIHENEAGIEIANAIAGDGITFSPPSEGKVNLKASYKGLLKIKVPLLEEINSIDDIVISTLHNNTICTPEMVVAGTRIIPLFTKKSIIEKVKDICLKEGKLIEILPFKKMLVGVIITGNEVYKGRIKDKFGDIIQKKIEAFNSKIIKRIITPDDTKIISDSILELKSLKVDIIIACGGLSVDPDDVTKKGVEKSGAKIISYGAPVLPGSMFLYALHNEVPILGAPACVLHHKATIFDLILPKILVGEKLSRSDIIKLGHGGLCQNCPKCTYPICPFGRGL